MSLNRSVCLSDRDYMTEIDTRKDTEIEKREIEKVINRLGLS